MFETTEQIAREGEEIVHKSLINSIWINSEQEKGFPYDIIWNNLMIDVKTTKRNTDTFTFKTQPDSDGPIIFIFIAIKDEEKYFWIGKPSGTVSVTLHPKNAIALEDLSAQILRLSHSDITNPEERKKRVNVWLKEEEYNQLRSDLITERSSVSKWMRLKIQEYLQQKYEKQNNQINTETISA